MFLIHVIHSGNPAGGGPMECAAQYCRALEGLGCEGEVVTLDAPGADFFQGWPVRCTGLGPGWPAGYGWSARFSEGIRERLEQADCLGAVVHGLWQWHGLATGREARRAGKAYWVFPHGMLDPWFKERHRLKHLKKLGYWLAAERGTLRGAERVLFTCEEERRLAQATFPGYAGRCAEEVVAFGIEDPPVAGEGERERLKQIFLERWPETRGRRILLYLGRMHPKKGADLLLEGLADALEAGGGRDAGQAHLVMAGPDGGEWQRGLERLAAGRRGLAGRVTWTGELRGEAKWGAFLAAETFALVSHQENFGLAVAEALACGRPALLSRRVNIWREIVGAEAGLAEEDTREGARRLAEEWLGWDATELARRGRAARECWERHFRIGAGAERLLEMARAKFSVA